MSGQLPSRKTAPQLRLGLELGLVLGLGEGQFSLGAIVLEPLYSGIGNNAQNSLQFALRQPEQKNY